MSVLNPVVETWDGEARRIYLKIGVTEFHPVIDLYAEYRQKRADDEAFRKWNPLILAGGNIKKSATTATPRYLVLLEGTKIVPYDEEGNLYQTGEIITDAPETDPTIYDTGALVNSIRIFISSPEAEIIYVSTGSGLSPEESAKLMAIPDALDNAQSVWDSHSRGDKLDFINNIDGGKWDINNNQMIFYMADGATEVARFNLFDASGSPTMSDVFSRVRV
jgi:hypothetical protein